MNVDKELRGVGMPPDARAGEKAVADGAVVKAPGDAHVPPPRERGWGLDRGPDIAPAPPGRAGAARRKTTRGYVNTTRENVNTAAKKAGSKMNDNANNLGRRNERTGAKEARTMARKTLATFMAVVLAVGLMPLPAFGDDGAVKGVSFNGNVVAASSETSLTVDGDGNVSGQTTDTVVDDEGNVEQQTTTTSPDGTQTVEVAGKQVDKLDDSANQTGQALIAKAAAKPSDGTIQDLPGMAEEGDLSVAYAVYLDDQKKYGASKLTLYTPEPSEEQSISEDSAVGADSIGPSEQVDAALGTAVLPTITDLSNTDTPIGYTLTGWSTTPTGKDVLDENGEVTREALTLPAGTQVTSWKVTLLTDGQGKDAEIVGALGADGEDVLLPGKATEKPAQREKNLKALVDEDGNLALYAQWAPATVVADAAEAIQEKADTAEADQAQEKAEAADAAETEAEANDDATDQDQDPVVAQVAEQALEATEAVDLEAGQPEVESANEAEDETADADNDTAEDNTSDDATEVAASNEAADGVADAAAEVEPEEAAEPEEALDPELPQLVADAQELVADNLEAAEEAAEEAALTPEQREDRDALAQLTDEQAFADFTSGRIIVGLDEGGAIAERDLGNIASSGNGVFLLQYKTQQDARAAFARYAHTYENIAFVAPDLQVEADDDAEEATSAVAEVAGQVEQAVEANAEPTALDDVAAAIEYEKAAELADESAPTADLEGIDEDAATLADEADVEDDEQLIALIDTGAPWHDNVLSRTSAIDDGEDAEIGDDNGHGTKMLETMLGENPDAKVISIKALDASGRGTAATVYAAIEQAVAAGATILNLSFSGYATEENAAIAEAIADAKAAGCEVVAAAGNNNMDAKWFTPANAEGAFTVGAANEDGTKVASSNYGENVDAWFVSSSTSFAAAHISGMLASYRGAYPASAFELSYLHELQSVALLDSIASGFAQNEDGTTGLRGVDGVSVSAGAQLDVSTIDVGLGYDTPDQIEGCGVGINEKHVVQVNVHTTGAYWITLRGADGGAAFDRVGGKGGQTTACVRLEAGLTYYAVVGNKGGTGTFISSGSNVALPGYPINGGTVPKGSKASSGSHYRTTAGGGGDATHLCTADYNQLSAHANDYSDTIIAVAGGGGGAKANERGDGGSGGAGNNSDSNYLSRNFGQGTEASGGSNNNAWGGGGGGLYGGINNYGGSGYVSDKFSCDYDTDHLAQLTTAEASDTGAGAFKIEFLGALPDKRSIGEGMTVASEGEYELVAGEEGYYYASCWGSGDHSGVASGIIHVASPGSSVWVKVSSDGTGATFSTRRLSAAAPYDEDKSDIYLHAGGNGSEESYANSTLLAKSHVNPNDRTQSVYIGDPVVEEGTHSGDGGFTIRKCYPINLYYSQKGTNGYNLFGKQYAPREVKTELVSVAKGTLDGNVDPTPYKLAGWLDADSKAWYDNNGWDRGEWGSYTREDYCDVMDGGEVTLGKYDDSKDLYAVCYREMKLRVANDTYVPFDAWFANGSYQDVSFDLDDMVYSPVGDSGFGILDVLGERAGYRVTWHVGGSYGANGWANNEFKYTTESADGFASHVRVTLSNNGDELPNSSYYLGATTTMRLWYLDGAFREKYVDTTATCYVPANTSSDPWKWELDMTDASSKVAASFDASTGWALDGWLDSLSLWRAREITDALLEGKLAKSLTSSFVPDQFPDGADLVAEYKRTVKVTYKRCGSPSATTTNIPAAQSTDQYMASDYGQDTLYVDLADNEVECAGWHRLDGSKWWLAAPGDGDYWDTHSRLEFDVDSASNVDAYARLVRDEYPVEVRYVDVVDGKVTNVKSTDLLSAKVELDYDNNMPILTVGGFPSYLADLIDISHLGPAADGRWSATGWELDTWLDSSLSELDLDYGSWHSTPEAPGSTLGTDITSSAAHVFYAVYSRDIDLKYYESSSSKTYKTQRVVQKYAYSTGVDRSVTLPALQDSGYSWAPSSWKVCKDGAVQASDTSNLKAEHAYVPGFATQANEIRAEYSRTATVTYNGNGSSGGAAPSATQLTQKFLTGDGSASGNTSYALPGRNTLAKTGSTFGGWGTSAGATSGMAEGTTYTFPYNAWDSAKDVTLYALWNLNGYKVEYNLNDASAAFGASHPTNVSYGQAFTVTNPTLAGYTFAGWYITGMDATPHTIGTGSAAVVTNENAYTYVKPTASLQLMNLTGAANATVKLNAVWVRATLNKTSYTYDGTAPSMTKELKPTGAANAGALAVSAAESGLDAAAGTNKQGKATWTVAKGDATNGGSVEATATYTIAKKALTVKANNKAITYGAAPANGGVTYTGNVGSDTFGTPTYTYSYKQYGDVGTYTITPGGLSNANYTITYQNGTLTVGKKALTGVSWGTTSFTYNGKEQAPAATVGTAQGVVNGDAVTVTVTGGKTNAGTGYTATASALSGAKAGNYSLPATAQTTTFSIAKADITPSVTMAGYTYGGTKSTPTTSGNAGNGTVTYYYAKATDSDSSAGTEWSKVTTSTSLPAGNYKIKASVAATTNYNAKTSAYTNFTIARATYTSAVSMASYAYGSTKPEPSVTNNPESGEVTYYYNTTNSNKNGTAWASVADASALAAGTYYLYAVISATTNYSAVTTPAAVFQVTEGAILDTAVTPPTPRTLTYSGSAQQLVLAGSAAGGTMQYSLTEGGTYSEGVPTATDAGDYAVWYYVKGDANHTDTAKAKVDVTIAKAASQVTRAPASAGRTYNGAAQGLVTAGTASGGAIQYSSAQSGTYSTTIPTGVDAKSYTVWYYVKGDKNHTDTAPASAQASIAQKALTVTASAQTLTYGNTIDTSVSKATLSGQVSGHTLGSVTLKASTTSVTSNGTVTPSAATIKNGDADVTSNYKISYATGKLVVNPITVGLTWGTRSFMYDGKSHVPTATATGLLAGDVCTVTVSGAQTEVGQDYTATATALSNANYALPAQKTTTFEIYNGTMSVVATPFSGTYDRTAHAITVSAPEGATVTYSADGATYGAEPVTRTDAGTTTVYYKVEKSGYTTQTGSSTVTITQREVGLSWGETEFTWDGTDKCPTATATGVIGGDTVTVAVAGAASASGEHTATATSLGGASAGNYKLPAATTKKFTILTKGMNVAASGFEGAYDGQPHTITVTPREPETAKVTYSTTETGAYTETAPTITNVGELEVYYKVTNDNYTETTGHRTVKVTQAPVGVAWTNTKQTYTGSELEPTATATGLFKQNGVTDECAVVISKTDGDNVNVGTSTWKAASLSGRSAGNYKLAANVADGTLEIEAAKMTVEAVGFSGVYDGQPHGVAVTVKTPADATGANVTYSAYYDAEGAGYEATSPTYTDVLKSGSNVLSQTVYYRVELANYVTVTGRESVTITPKPVSLTWTDTSLTYNGSSQGPTATVKADDLVGGDELTVTVAGQQVAANAGSSTYTATATRLNGEKAANYTLPASPQTPFRIEAAPMTVTADGYNGAFDGKEHGIAVDTSKAGTDADVSVTYSTAQDGTYGAEPKYKEPGTYTVWFKATCPNYQTVNESRTVVITKRTVGLDWGVTSGIPEVTYTGESWHPTATVTGTVSGYPASVAAYVGEASDAGLHETEATALDADGDKYYVLPADAKTQFRILAAEVKAYANDLTVTYDGSPHQIEIQVNSKQLDSSVKLKTVYTVKQADKDDVTYDGTTPTFTNVADSCTVEYTITDADNAGNVYSENQSVTVTINPLEASVEWGTTTFGYNAADTVGVAPTATVTNLQTQGETIDACAVTVGVSDTEDGTFEDNAKRTAAGTYWAEATALGNPNYKLPAVRPKTEFTISTAAMTVEAKDYVGVYDGAAHGITVGFPEGATAPDGYKIQYSEDGTTFRDDPYTYTEVAMSGGKATTRTVFYKVTAPNYTDVTGSKTVDIRQKEVGLAWGDTTLTFTGEPQAPTATATGLVNADDVTYVAVEGQQTDVGSSYTATATALYRTEGGEVNTNYALPANASTKFQINAAPLKVEASGFLGTYDGQMHGITVAAPAGSKVTYSLDGTSFRLTQNPEYRDVRWVSVKDDEGDGEDDEEGDDEGDEGDEGDEEITPAEPVETEIGEYKVWFRVEQDNYETVTDYRTVRINPREVGLAWSDTTFTYDGNSHVPTATLSGVVEGDELGVTVTGAEVNVNTVGTPAYTATASELTGASAGNYVLPEANTAPFTIVPASMVVVSSPYTGPYDGEAHAISIKVTDPDLKYTVAYKGETDSAYDDSYSLGEMPTFSEPGEHTVYYKVTADNYNSWTGSNTVTITPKVVGLTWSDEATFTYDGDEHVRQATATGLVAGKDCVVTVDGAQAGAGEWTATASGLKDSESAAEASKYYALPSSSADLSAKFDIARRPVTISGTDAEVFYNGEEQVNSATEAEGLVGDDVYDAVSSAKGTNVGTYEGTIEDGAAVKVWNKDRTQELTANYDVTTVPGSITVKRRAITVTAHALVHAYDGEQADEAKIEASVDYGTDAQGEWKGGEFKAYAGEFADGAQLVWSGDVQAGAVRAVPTGVAEEVPYVVEDAEHVEAHYPTYDQGNLRVTYVPADLSFTASGKALKVTPKSVTAKVYDGTALEPDGYDVEGDALVDGDELEVELAGSQTIAGTSQASVASAKVMHGDADVTGAYTLDASDTADLTVNKRAVELVGESATKVYDAGKEFEINGITPEDGGANGGLVDGESVVAKYSAKGAGEADVDSIEYNGTFTDKDGGSVPGRSIENAAGEDVTSSYDITFTAGKLTVVSPTNAFTAESVTLTPATFTFNGQKQQPEVKIETNHELASGTEYTLSWPTASYVTAGNKQVKVTGKGAYAGITFRVPFTIEALALTRATASAVKAGADADPGVKVFAGDDEVTMRGTYVTVKYLDASGNEATSLVTPGEYTAVVAGDGRNVVGNLKVPFTVTAADPDPATESEVTDKGDGTTETVTKELGEGGEVEKTTVKQEKVTDPNDEGGTTIETITVEFGGDPDKGALPTGGTVTVETIDDLGGGVRHITEVEKVYGSDGWETDGGGTWSCGLPPVSGTESDITETDNGDGSKTTVRTDVDYDGEPGADGTPTGGSVTTTTESGDPSDEGGKKTETVKVDYDGDPADGGSVTGAKKTDTVEKDNGDGTTTVETTEVNYNGDPEQGGKATSGKKTTVTEGDDGEGGTKTETTVVTYSGDPADGKATGGTVTTTIESGDPRDEGGKTTETTEVTFDGDPADEGAQPTGGKEVTTVVKDDGNGGTVTVETEKEYGPEGWTQTDGGDGDGGSWSCGLPPAEVTVTTTKESGDEEGGKTTEVTEVKYDGDPDNGGTATGGTKTTTKVSGDPGSDGGKTTETTEVKYDGDPADGGIATGGTKTTTNEQVDDDGEKRTKTTEVDYDGDPDDGGQPTGGKTTETTESGDPTEEGGKTTETVETEYSGDPDNGGTATGGTKTTTNEKVGDDGTTTTETTEVKYEGDPADGGEATGGKKTTTTETPDGYGGKTTETTEVNYEGDPDGDGTPTTSTVTTTTETGDPKGGDGKVTETTVVNYDGDPEDNDVTGGTKTTTTETVDENGNKRIETIEADYGSDDPTDPDAEPSGGKKIVTIETDDGNGGVNTVTTEEVYDEGDPADVFNKPSGSSEVEQNATDNGDGTKTTELTVKAVKDGEPVEVTTTFTTDADGNVVAVSGDGVEVSGDALAPLASGSSWLVLDVNLEAAENMSAKAKEIVEGLGDREIVNVYDVTLWIVDSAGNKTKVSQELGSAMAVKIPLTSGTGLNGRTAEAWHVHYDGDDAEPEVTAYGRKAVVSGGVTVSASKLSEFIVASVNQHTVSFDANGGTGEMAPVKADEGSYTVPANGFTAPAGKAFAGWKASNEGNLVSVGSAYELAEDVTFYAQWIDVGTTTYAVSFDANGGTGSMAAAEALAGAYTLPANGFTAPSGKVFTGWKANNEGETLVAGATYDVEANVIFYAQWADVDATFTVAYDANGGSGSVAAQSGKVGTTVNVAANGFTRTGYTFASWNTRADGKGTSYAPGAAIVLASNLTLFAQWTAVAEPPTTPTTPTTPTPSTTEKATRTVTFMANGGTGTMAAQKVADSTATALAANAFTRTGYTFNGWNTRADGKGVAYADKVAVTLTADVTLYAQWAANKYTVTYKPNGGKGSAKKQSVTYGSTWTSKGETTFTRSGYTLTSWNTKANGKGTKYTTGQAQSAWAIAAATTLYAQWTKTDQVKGADGTAFGTGATLAAAEKAISSMKSDDDPKGTVFRDLKFRVTKVGKTSMKLGWSKVKGAAKYVVYGNKCGKDPKTGKIIKLTKLKTLAKSKTAWTWSKLNKKKLTKGTYYKVMLVALDKNGRVISTSKVSHVATTGGKTTNPKSVTTAAKGSKVTLAKKGKTFKLKAKVVKVSKKLKLSNHRGLKYETSDKKVATVSAKGVIKAVAKGTCYVYVYAQNGAYKRIKVTVKK